MTFTPHIAQYAVRSACEMFGIVVQEDREGGAGVELGAAVQVSGAWEGRVELWCTRRFGLKLAMEATGLPIADIDDALVTDALCELTNITSGALKSMLPPGCTMSVPVVAKEFGGNVSSQVYRFRSNGEMVVLVIQ